MTKLILLLLALSSIFVSIDCVERDNAEPLFLSEYILKGDVSTAKSLSLVRHREMDWLTSYAGYITTNRLLNSNMFFWFFPAKYGASSSPLVLWLQGGPGMSSMVGLFKENGPFAIGDAGSLKSRKYSWHLNHNVLYIDNPIGTGHSFTGFDAGYARNQNDIGSNLYNVLQQFLMVFPEVRENPLYITGESYAGKYVVSVAHTILKYTPTFTSKNKINLQGLAIGSGFLDPINMLNYADVLHQNGMIDSNGWRLFKEYEEYAVNAIRRQDYSGALHEIDHLILNLFYKSDTLFTNLTGSTNYHNALAVDRYEFPDVYRFMNRPDVKRAINVGSVEFQSNEFNNVYLREEDQKVAYYLKRDILQSVAPLLVELLSHYNVFLFNGQSDILCGYPASEQFLQNLNFEAAEEYATAERKVWRVENEVAGYVKQAGRLTEIVVRNAGHFISIDQPKYVLEILTKLTSGEGFRFDRK